MKIRGGNRPPWREHIPAHYEWINELGRAIQIARATPDPDRPMVWHEIVRGDRVVMRSLRPLARLITVVQPGERIYRTRRKDVGRSLHAVNRTLVYGAVE